MEYIAEVHLSPAATNVNQLEKDGDVVGYVTGSFKTTLIFRCESTRGNLLECEDNWNCQLEDITYSAKNHQEIAMDITQFLLAAQSADAQVRTEAESTLKQLQEDKKLLLFLPSLALELADEDKPIGSRLLAGSLLRRSVDAEDSTRGDNQWCAVDFGNKHQIKEHLLNTLGSSSPEARHLAAQIIAKVAYIEIPQNHWPELLRSLFENMTRQGSTQQLKQSTLETMSYVCEEISADDLVQEDVKHALNVVVQGMVYKETACTEDEEIRLAAYECLVFIASTFYNVLEQDMETFMQLTLDAIKGNEKKIAVQAIEFWSSICHEEIDRQKYATPHSCFIEKALSHLVPILLGTLEKQDDDHEDDVWNMSMAGRTCLRLVSRTVGDDIMAFVMPYVESKITQVNWRSREAAIYAFGSTLEGTKILDAGMVTTFFGLLNTDENNNVRETTAWTLSRIFEFSHTPDREFSVMSNENSAENVFALLDALKDAPNVAAMVCGAIYNLSQGYEDTLYSYRKVIINRLLAAAERIDAAEFNLRDVAYDTLSELIQCSDCGLVSSTIGNLLPVFMEKLSQTMDLSIISTKDREKRDTPVFFVWCSPGHNPEAEHRG